LAVRRLSRCLFVLFGTAALLCVLVTSSSASSCAPHPRGSPLDIALGREVLAVDATFPERFDGAILGVVTHVRTQDDGDRPDYGRTEVTVRVTGEFGPEVPDPATVVQDDPGWLHGYPFELGRHYFIPYVQSADGLRSHACDPVSEVAEAEAFALVRVAGTHGWQGASTTDSSPGSRRSIWLAVLLGLLASSGAYVYLRGRPERTPPGRD